MLDSNQDVREIMVEEVGESECIPHCSLELDMVRSRLHLDPSKVC